MGTHDQTASRPSKRSAIFRFYAELNDFLPGAQRQREIRYEFWGTPAVKDAIEAIGVPHPEVDLIIVNDVSVDFNHHLREGDRVAVYPVFEGLDISPVVRLRPEPLREVRFVVDGHLGTLARRLRLLGFDTEFDPGAADEDIVHSQVVERRIILTRDRSMLKAGSVTHGYWVRSADPDAQVREVVDRFDVGARARPFTRCLVCNGKITETVDVPSPGEVPEGVLDRHDRFYRCDGCGRIYWKGTHYRRLREWVDRMGVG